ncbi:MAG: zinc ribbon domain-containing protein [Lachnospiraceae bacterium]|nr:zinc ribbon domain-containing protein [Lachnospiraceae bacterium]
MQGTKKCAHCNHENPARQMYCLHCGKYLTGKTEQKRKTTVWDLEGTVPAGGVSVPPIKDEDVVICPQCAQVTAVENGVLPLACSICGYFFDIMADKIIRRSEAVKSAERNRGVSDDNKPSDDEKKDRNLSGSGNDTAQKTKDMGYKRDILHPKENDTRLRLIIRNRDGHRPEEVNPLGDIIGKDGTVLKDLNLKTKIKIFRAPTGWYAEVLAGEAMIEGEAVNRQIERQLENGNIIAVEGHMIFTEISEE